MMSTHGMSSQRFMVLSEIKGILPVPMIVVSYHMVFFPMSCSKWGYSFCACAEAYSITDEKAGQTCF